MTARSVSTATKLLLLGVIGTVSACGLCGDDIVAQATSHDGRRKAILNVRNCGATTDYNNWLTVEVPEKWWTVTALSGELCMHRPDDAELRWDGNDLVVTCKRCCPERLRSKTETVGKTTIRFEGFEPRPAGAPSR